MRSHSVADAPLAPAASSRAVAPPVKAGLPPGAAVAMMVASGFAGLGYQIVWTQQSAQWLGHEAAAVLAVVAAFFGGLALGALALGGRVQRSRQPAHWYAACEGVIALWSLALALWLSPISAWMLSLIGAQPSPLWQWLVAFFGTFLVLLPATAAMGATLPAMERVLAQVDGSPNRFGTLYASNTLGAVIGVLASAFWLVPSIGLLRTAGVCAALNLLCAGIALFLAARVKAIPASSLGNVSQSTSTAATTPKHVLWMLATTGLLGIGYEVLVVRVISQVTQNTVYTFAILLAVYLVGTAAGAALYQRWRDRSFAAVRAIGAIGAMGAPGAGPSADASKPVATDEVLRDQLLLALAVACLLGTGSLWFAEDLHGAVLRGLGPGMASSLAAEAALALAAFALPTMLMGALFSHLCLLARGAGAAAASAGDGPNRPIGSSFGLSLGVNTLGAALAAPVFGAWLAPAMGAKWSLLLVAGAYLALVLPRAWFKTRANVGLRVKLGGVLALGLALAIWAPPLVFIDVPPGAQVVSYQEGVMAAVSVVEDAQGVSRLRINNRQQEGSSASQLADARQALLPLLLHPEPKRALFLGLGTGVTARAAAQDASLQVDVAELLPEVIAAARHFAPEPSPGDNRARERLNILPADARRFVRASNASYDVIISDNFHPARSGSGALYTVEHFQAVRARLAEGGLFCQWLPLHQLDLASLQSIVKSFLAVYPDGAAMLATHSLETPVLGLVGRAGESNPNSINLQRLRERLDRQQLSPRLADFGITDELALLGGFIASHQSLARFAANALLNTDDHPVVAYLAPRATYAPEALPRDRLLTLLGELKVGDMKVSPADLVKVIAAQDGAWPQRLTAYWQARDLFIDAGRNVQPRADVREMLAQVQAPLLAVLRVSPDFRPAYDPLLRMATALARQDKPAAVALLSQLQQLQPARPEATQALEALDALR